MKSNILIINDPLDEKNYLTPMRWILAATVALAHAWEVTDGNDPLGLYNWQASDLAVNGFFILSGLLIAKSLTTRQDLQSFFRSRVLRIYPALVVVLLVMMFVLGPIFSDPGGAGFLFDPEAWSFFFRTLLMGEPRVVIAGVFDGNAMPHFNAPLWTIRFEIACYVIAGLAFTYGGVHTKWRATIAALILLLLNFILSFPAFANLGEEVHDFFRLISAFSIGFALYFWPRTRTPGRVMVALVAILFVLAGKSVFGEISGNFTIAVALMHFGLSKWPLQFLHKLPDYSYGIYIWHFPVLQALVYLWPDLTPWELLLSGGPIFLGCAALSWHLIEHPALKFKTKTLSLGRQPWKHS